MSIDAAIKPVVEHADVVSSTHIEAPDKYNDMHSASGRTGFSTKSDDVPPGYFRSAYFLGTMAAICFSLDAGVAGYTYAAPLLSLINEDIGPSPNISWVSLAYTLTSAVCFVAVERVGDVFGRRYLFIGGTSLALLGTIICAVAQSVPMLIGGMTLIGIGGSTQLSYYYIMGEILPMKYRLAGNGVIYVSQIFTGGFAPIIGRALVVYRPEVGWRGVFYIVIGLNVAALVCWVAFYHPPDFKAKHADDKMSTYIRRFDYIGLVLFTGGMLVLLFGLKWGGTVYPWSSSRVIASITTGAISLILFGLWETYSGLKEPLVPVYIFRNGPWLNATVISGIGISMYYSLATVWPDMVDVLYADPNSPLSAAWLATLLGLGLIVGEVAGGFIGKPLRHLKWQCLVTFLIGGVFFACIATCGPDDQARVSAFVALGVFFGGWSEALSVTMVTLTVRRQDELGTASGVAGSVRFLISTLATVVYTVSLEHKLDATVGPAVNAAVRDAGLPASSVAQFLDALPSGVAALQGGNIPGVTDSVIQAGIHAYKQVSSTAYGMVFLITIALTGIGVICCLLLPDIDRLLTDEIVVTIGRSQRPATTSTEKGEDEV